jgi:hypothetical protein
MGSAAHQTLMSAGGDMPDTFVAQVPLKIPAGRSLRRNLQAGPCALP